MHLFRSKDFSAIIICAAASIVFAALTLQDKQSSVTASSGYVGFPYDTVIIDPGHGGIDGGAVGSRGTFEKDINLSISDILYSLFTCTDISSVMTRTGDELLFDEENKFQSKKTQDLSNRVSYTDKFPNPVFVSIHQNKFPVSKYRGLQVYYSKNSEESINIAQNIQDITRQLLQNDNNREIKKAGSNIYVLKKTKCPAVLVECGFLSNPEEEALLCDMDYQKKIAICIFKALLNSGI